MLCYAAGVLTWLTPQFLVGYFVRMYESYESYQIMLETCQKPPIGGMILGFGQRLGLTRVDHAHYSSFRRCMALLWGLGCGFSSFLPHLSHKKGCIC